MSNNEESKVKDISVKQENAVSEPVDMIQFALQNGASMEQLEKLMDMKERHDAAEAKKAYVDAMNRFRSQCPTIAKTRQAHNSKYAGLAETIEQIKSLLSECGLSHSWKTSREDGLISVTCCVTHVAGHQECTSLSAPPDTSGSKNPIQAMASTVSYLERYTFYALLGLASAEMDDDGNMAYGNKTERLNDDQIAEIEALAEEVNVKPVAIAAAYNEASLEEVNAKWYGKIIAQLETKRKETK
jgi:hypothetical protein